jgi:hypothetical protein
MAVNKRSIKMLANKILLIGTIGALIVIISMLVGMPAKILFMNNVSFTLVSIFFLSMVITNIGIKFMGLGLFVESLK